MDASEQGHAVPPPTGRLSVVACPLVPAELPAALANLARWDAEWARVPPDPAVRPVMMFVFNGAADPALEAPLRDAWSRLPRAAATFAALEVVFLALPPDKDLYVRHPVGPPPPMGFKSGPNWMFLGTLHNAARHGGFLFLMETDCQPLIPRWLAALDRTCRRNDDAWVVGAHYSGASPLVSTLARHINGNALYQAGDPDFLAFVDDFFWPWMLRHIQGHEPNLAYDCAWDSFLGSTAMEDTGHHDWHRARDVLHRFRLTGSIVNVAGHAEQRGHYAWTRAQLLRRFPQAAVVHGPVAEDDDHRRGALNVGRATSEALAIADGTARFLSNDGRYARSLWLEGRDFARGQQVIVRARIADAAHRRLQVQVRDARGAVLESIRSVQASADGREAKAVFTLADPHRFLHLHFRPIGAPEAQAGLSMAEVKVAVREQDQQVAHLRDLLR